MNQKGFANNIIVLIAIIIVLGSIGTYFILNRQIQPPSAPNPTPTLIPSVPVLGPITVNGEIACLPKKGSGLHTAECAIGLKGSDGRHYGLKNLFEHDPEHKFSATGSQVEVSGIFSPEEISGPGGAKYDVVGTIDVTSIKAVVEGN